MKKLQIEMTREEREETIHRMLEAVYKFIEESEYLKNPHVLGFVLYGSYTTGYWHSGSDVDMHIIMDNSVKKTYRCVSTVNGFRIEHFVKPIRSIYNGVDIDFITNENAYLTMIGHGKIIHDRYGLIKKLQEYILKRYSQPMPALSKDEAIESAAIIQNKIDELKKLLERKSIFFDMYYYRVLDSIRKFYSRRCGCANIPLDKVERIYTDPQYAISFCKESIPDKRFRDNFFAVVKYRGSNEIKLMLIKNLFKYSIKGLDFDNDNYCVEVIDRHDLKCRTH